MYKYLIVDEKNRLDKFLTKHFNSSRNQIEQMIKASFVKVDEKIITKTGYKLEINQKIEVKVEVAKKNLEPEEKIDFEIERIYEDEHILVINKPINLVVHKAPSVKEPTLVDWLRFNNISLSTLSAKERHGIVHRLDKGTSGAMVVAKTNLAQASLAKQLQSKEMGRYYLALIDLPLKENTIIENHLGRNPKNRLRISAVKDGRYAKSAFLKLCTSKNNSFELISAKLFTGRTHQIRAHLNSISRHILGDDLYGFKSKLSKISRIYLHAYTLYLSHPLSGEKISFVAKVPNDFNIFLEDYFLKDEINEKINPDFIFNNFNNFC